MQNNRSKEGLFEFYADCGRNGDLEGKFVTTQEKVDKLVETKMDIGFGDVLGKHSDISTPIEKGEISFVTFNKEAMKYGVGGINPFEYYSHEFSVGRKSYEQWPVDAIIDDLLKKDAAKLKKDAAKLRKEKKEEVNT